jgi:PTH1 family peptidyl-tRNA hydrolase
MKVLVGLGNPGGKYEQNRHNAGFMAVDAIASYYKAPSWRKRFQGFATELEIGGQKCLLLKPSTYMNESGRAVTEAASFYKLAPGDVIVFHDELDLEPGKIRVKTGGGHAGHNGLRSISAHIGNEYRRVRIGIGHPGSRDVVVHYVLHDFARADREWLEPLFDSMAKSAAHLVAGHDAKFMNDVARLTRPATASAPAKPAQAEAAPKVENSAKADPTSNAGAEPPETSLGAKLRSWLNRS